MPDYDLTGLSSRSFEQLIQALACKVLGPGIVVFGDGPDGGREATFKGRLFEFPSAKNPWDGYIVLQAKFCQRPKMKNKEDTKWALNHLQKELEAFAKRRTKRKRPEFYIFATNVVLTAVQGSGGKDSLSSLLDEYKEKIGIKEYHIWDYDQICRFLDSDANVRNAYGAWITPGDVLAKMAAKIEEKAPDFTKIMVNFLQKEMMDDHFSKLEQAGHSAKNRIALEEVFVDLPALDVQKPEASSEETELSPGFLSEMLAVGCTCLRPDDPGVLESKQQDLGRAGIKAEHGRFVLVGGPGQGKSTLAQFLCQIHRANLLKDKRGIDNDVKETVKSIGRHCNSQLLELGMARRFPLRLELARFAKILASQIETGVNSVLSYAAYIIKDRTNYELTAEDLRRWLEIFPWLIILDGLDEVPASSNRSQVLDAIRDFLVDISMCNGDVLVLSTTRPQGYNEEFSPHRYQHRYLTPLSIPRALHYGQKLVELTYAHDSQRKKEVLRRLKDAATIPATARLMESPLQITIMARLLAEVAQPPQERYKLFQQYYKVIYRREMERGVETLSQILREHEANVDSIHQRTGLLLQMESEKTRHTDATITIDQFKAVVAGRLRDEGYSGIPLEKLAQAISICATNRLVFLVPSQSERVGFEIRSLQEFMAAEALMDGSDNLVVERLRAIAPVPFWQNVLLFAAGKCFAERQWLRDCISQICGELNDDPKDNLAHLVLAGSRMALSLLEDGPARWQPAYSQVLARRALSLLELPAERIHERLSDVFEPAFERVYREELSRDLQTTEFGQRLAAWVLLSKMISDKKLTWAQETADLYWPKNAIHLTQLFRKLNIPENQWALEKYAKYFFEVPLLFHPRYYHPQGRIPFLDIFKSNKLAIQALDLELAWRDKPGALIKGFSISGFGRLTIPMISLGESRKLLGGFSSLESFDEYWKLLKESALFAKQPSIGGLIKCLEAMADGYVPQPYNYLYAPSLPWPILACLGSARNGEEIRELANRVRRGEMGGPGDWEGAELRWRSIGVTKADLEYMTDERWPIPRDIARIGFPFAFLKYMWHMDHKIDKGEELQTFWQSLPGNRARGIFSEIIMQSYDRRAAPLRKTIKSSSFPAELVVDIVSNLENDQYWSADDLSKLLEKIADSPKAPHALDKIGRLISSRSLYVGAAERESVKKVVQFAAKILERDRSLDGIFNLVSILAASSTIDYVPGYFDELNLRNKSDGSKSRLILRLTQRGLDANAIEQITREIFDGLGNDEDRIWMSLKVYENHQMDNPNAVRFLEKLLELLPISFINARNQIIRILTDLLGRRVALLSERQIWNNLGLPQCLYDQIRN